MSEEVKRKCSYYNSGYCKFSRQAKGCRFIHPEENCKLTKCRDKLCPKRHPKACKFRDECRYQTRCCYRHNERYTNKGDDKEVIELKAEIKSLKSQINTITEENSVKFNNLVKVHLTEIKELRLENQSLKQTPDLPEATLSVEDKTDALSDKAETCDAEKDEDSVFTQKSIEMFRYVGFNEDSDADIKMYVVHRENWKSKTLCENLIECPECAKDFNTIAELKSHDRDFNLSCHQCGKCFKESERPHSAYCLPDDSFEKTPIEEHHALQLKLKKGWGLGGT